MKLFISADIEGVTGATTWEDTEPGKSSYNTYVKQMSREIAAACRAALESGFDEIIVKDAHEDGTNIDMYALPPEAVLVRGMVPSPYNMVEGVDEDCSAAVFIGYHSAASTAGSPLAHTFTSKKIYKMSINDKIVSEYRFNALVLAKYSIPLVCVSGDKGLCESVKSDNSNIETCSVKECKGRASISIHPDRACELIYKGVRNGLQNADACVFPVPDKLEIRWTFHSAAESVRGSYYPGVQRLDDCTLSYQAGSIDDLMSANMFVLDLGR